MALRETFAKEGFNAPIGPVGFLGMATFSQFGMSFTQQGIAVLSVVVAQHYHLSLAQMGLVVSATSLGVMVSQVFLGAVADRWGPRRLLLWGCSAMTLAALGVGQAVRWHVLLATLFVLGFTMSATPAAGMKAVFQAWTGRPRALPMGIRQTAVPFGGALGAAFLPALAGQWGLSNIFRGLAALLFCTSLSFGLLVPGARQVSPAPAPAHPSPTSPWRRLALPAVVTFLLVSAQYSLVTDSIPYLTRDFHQSLTAAGILVGIGQAGGGVGRIVFGSLADRWGLRPVIMRVAMLAALTAVGVAFLPRNLPYAGLAVVWFILGMGSVGWNALALTWGGERVSAEAAGLAMGTVNASMFLGAAVFPPVFGAVVDAAGGFMVAWLGLALVVLIAITLLWKADAPA